MAGLRTGFTTFITKPHIFMHGLPCLLRFVHSTCIRFFERVRLTSPDPSTNLEIEDAKLSLSELPPLPTRTRAYYTEPLHGIFLVAGLCATLLQMVRGVASFEALSDSSAVQVASWLIWCFASVAVACTAHITFGRAGQIQRSEATCFPIPDAVRELLLDSKPPEQLAYNLSGPDGASYCIRCLVWRPPAAHHCSVCRRCVVGFDHHCSTFGRCIVRSNMPCFVALYTMLFAGFVTMLFCFAMYAVAPEPPGLILHTMDMRPIR